MKICLFGAAGKVGSVLAPALEHAGHEVVDGRAAGPEGCDVAVDFTRPDAVAGNVERCLEARVPVVIGTSGFDPEALDRQAQEAGVPCFHAPNFAVGAVLMMRFAEEASRVLERAEIVELHADTKLDAPSGTAKATAARMEARCRSTRFACRASSHTRRSSSAVPARRSPSGTTRPRAMCSPLASCARSRPSAICRPA